MYICYANNKLLGLIHAMRTSVVRNGTVSYKQEDTKSAADNSKSAELSACDGQATNNHDNDAIGKKEEVSDSRCVLSCIILGTSD